MKGCVFCEIVNDDPFAQIEQVYRNGCVITPRAPVVPGHKLMIARLHVTSAKDAPAITGLVMRDVADYLGEEDIRACNIITSVGAPATQTVFHMHVHIVPRHEGDGVRLPWTP